jgi:class 3 adenylate cyclase
MRLGGELRAVTVLFADIRGFTRFTEQHSAPEVITALNTIFESLSEVVFLHHGTFDKYLGDGLMTFFGAPVAEQDDAQRALDTALEMQRRFVGLRKKHRADFEGLGLGIGLHSGDAVVGNIGSEAVMDYTVVGDVVNVAKRLQERASGGQILLSEATFQQVKVKGAEPMEGIELPGRQELVRAYRIDG